MSPELSALLPSVRAFCRAELHPLEIDQQHSIPTTVLDGLRELGVFGVTLPSAYGGSGLGARDAAQLVTVLAEHDRSVATTVGLHLGLGTRGLVAFGSPAQHERWLPALASGERLAAFATTEPGAGSDLSAIECTARLEGDSLWLRGTKLFVTNGGLCSLLTVTARTPQLANAPRATSLLLVNPAAEGIERQREEHKLGLRGSSTTAFVFDDCRLDASAVVGVPGNGAAHLTHVLSWGRLLLSAGCVGTARTALTAALAHTHTRCQFRRALISQEVVQQQLSRAWALVFGMRALVEDAAESADDFETLARLTTSAKVFCSEAAGWVADLALQLHGGSGYIEDTGLALLVRDARVTRIFEGANDVLLTHAGLGELSCPLVDDSSFAARVVASRREALIDDCGAQDCRGGGDPAGPSLAVLRRKADQHALGRAVVWRDAAMAALSRAHSREERAAAELLEAEAIVIATAPQPSAEPLAVVTCALLGSVVP